MADVWVGGETGILKGVDLNKKTYQNYGDIANAEKEVDEICRMCWFDDEERKICMGIRSGVCKIFDVEVGDFIDERKCFDQSDGRIVGLDRNERALMVCCENGIMRIFHDSSEAKTDVKVGSHVARMRINPFEKCQVATGGNENVLKLWDLNRPEKPLFKAKNVRNDHLDLQVPEYVKDIAFLSSPGSLPRIIVANIYHKLRVYDPEAQRRPVLDFSYEDSPITCVALPSHERFVVVGNALGEMAAIDIRNGKNLGSFKFFSGTINDIYCHRSEPLVASCGLDRFLRVHHMESRKLVNKIYMKSRLNSVLFSKNAKKSGEKANLGKRKQDKEIGDECDGDEDDIWRNMSVVIDDVIEKKTKPSGGNEDREG